jgi:thioredoxin 1
MSKTWKLLIVAGLAAAVVIVLLAKQADKRTAAATHPAASPATGSVPATRPAGLPRLVDLGGRQCKVCMEMAPILEQLAADFAGRLEVDFFDVWAAPEVGKSFGIRLIPTQIFFDAEGRELFRHEGFMSRQDILDKWKELGVDLQAPAP